MSFCRPHFAGGFSLRLRGAMKILKTVDKNFVFV
jgi:hypothetical protein